MSRIVMYLVSEKHLAHPVSVGHSKVESGEGCRETVDGAVALPEGALLNSVICVLCGVPLRLGEDFRVETQDFVALKEDEPDPSREPWRQDPEGWRG